MRVELSLNSRYSIVSAWGAVKARARALVAAVTVRGVMLARQANGEEEAVPVPA